MFIVFPSLHWDRRTAGGSIYGISSVALSFFLLHHNIHIFHILQNVTLYHPAAIQANIHMWGMRTGLCSLTLGRACFGVTLRGRRLSEFFISCCAMHGASLYTYIILFRLITWR